MRRRNGFSSIANVPVDAIPEKFRHNGRGSTKRNGRLDLLLYTHFEIPESKLLNAVMHGQILARILKLRSSTGAKPKFMSCFVHGGCLAREALTDHGNIIPS